MKRWVAQYQTTTNGMWFRGDVGYMFNQPHVMFEAWWQDWYRTEDWWFDKERYGRWFRALGWWQRQAATRPATLNTVNEGVRRAVRWWGERTVEPPLQRHRGLQ